jgi:hypothetical protein
MANPLTEPVPPFQALEASNRSAREWLIELNADTEAPNPRQVAEVMQRLIAKRGQHFEIEELEAAFLELKTNPPEASVPALTIQRVPATSTENSVPAGPQKGTRQWDILRPENNAIRRGILRILENPGQPLPNTNNGQARQITPLLKERFGIIAREETVRKHLCAIRPNQKLQHPRGALAKAVNDRLDRPEVKAVKPDEQSVFLAKLIEQETGIPTNSSVVWRILEGQKSLEERQRTQIRQLRQEATSLRVQNTRLKASNAKLMKAPTSTRAVRDRNSVLSKENSLLKTQNERLRAWNKRAFDALRVCFDELRAVMPLRTTPNSRVRDSKALEFSVRQCIDVMKDALPGRGHIKKKRRKKNKEDTKRA